MLESLLYRLLLPGLAYGLVLNLLWLEELSEELAQQFRTDVRQMQCAHYKALEKNLYVAQLYVLERHDSDEEAVLKEGEDFLEQWKPETDCPSIHLYRQENRELPEDYPNYWVRWPDASAGERAGG